MGRSKFDLCSWAKLSILVFGVVMTLGQEMVSPGPMPINPKCKVYEKLLCGAPSISSADCEALNCCFDGLLCYYGNTVTVQCAEDEHFLIVVARNATEPQLALDSVFLQGGNEAPCRPVGVTDSFAFFHIPLQACGTVLKEEDGYMVYENRMLSSYEVGIEPLGSVTKDSYFELLFKCRYWGSAPVSLVAEVNTIAPTPPVAAAGPLRVELRLANGQCSTKGCLEGDSAYTSYYMETDYPVTKVLQQPVHVEVRVLERTDPKIFLLLEDCWATSTPSPLNLPQWKLLVNGCPYLADQYLTTLVPVDGSSGLPFPTHYKRFIVKMSALVDAASMIPLKVFIHCSATVCSPSATDSCEQRCFTNVTDVAAVQNSSHEVVVSSGEIILSSPELPALDMQQSGREVPLSYSYGVLAVVTSVIGVFALMLAVVWRSQCRLAMRMTDLIKALDLYLYSRCSLCPYFHSNCM